MIHATVVGTSRTEVVHNLSKVVTVRRAIKVAVLVVIRARRVYLYPDVIALAIFPKA